MITKAFLLGAGLGTRLRPLTDLLPKPLVPLFHKPLIEWAMEACARAGIREFAINTHHLPECWRGKDLGWSLEEAPGLTGENGVAASRANWAGMPVRFFHEPELLETGGGLRNLTAWIGDNPVLVHNGDIFSSMALPKLLAAHQASGQPVTLALRSQGEARHIALEGDRVIDIREMLGRAPGTHVFSGIYVFSPELLDLIPSGRKISVIPAFLELARSDRLGAVTLDDGIWCDLGDLPGYLAAHRRLALASPIHTAARVSPEAEILDSVVGPGAVVEAGAAVIRSVLWPGARVASGETLTDAVATACGRVVAPLGKV